jgi:hypothetical protein
LATPHIMQRTQQISSACGVLSESDTWTFWSVSKIYLSPPACRLRS